MSREKSWQVPGKGAIYKIPTWVLENGAYAYPKDKFTLPDGSVAGTGDWLILKNGQLTKK